MVQVPKPAWAQVEARYLSLGYTPVLDAHSDAVASALYCMVDCVPLRAVDLTKTDDEGRARFLRFAVCPSCSDFILWDAHVPASAGVA